jgi:hypothetical protein
MILHVSRHATDLLDKACTTGCLYAVWFSRRIKKSKKAGKGYGRTLCTQYQPLRPAFSILRIEGLLPRVKQTVGNHFFCADELPLPARSGHSLPRKTQAKRNPPKRVNFVD